MDIEAIKTAVVALNAEGVLNVFSDGSIYLCRQRFMEQFDLGEVVVIKEGSKDYLYHLKAERGGIVFTTAVSAEEWNFFVTERGRRDNEAQVSAD